MTDREKADHALEMTRTAQDRMKRIARSWLEDDRVRAWLRSRAGNDGKTDEDGTATITHRPDVP